MSGIHSTLLPFNFKNINPSITSKLGKLFSWSNMILKNGSLSNLWHNDSGNLIFEFVALITSVSLTVTGTPGLKSSRYSCFSDLSNFDWLGYSSATCKSFQFIFGWLVCLTFSGTNSSSCLSAVAGGSPNWELSCKFSTLL